MWVDVFQLTRPCGSRHYWHKKWRWSEDVSTHATLRVATRSGFKRLRDGISFNSRDPAGRDPSALRLLLSLDSFNSRDPAGRDLGGTQCFPFFLYVSTHATLRVATMYGCGCGYGRDVSTHATLRVATCGMARWQTGRTRFNSRDPAGRDVGGVHEFWDGVGFQLTRPCGSRQALQLANRTTWLFQLTRPCGSRRANRTLQPKAYEFQLTRPCGSRLLTLAKQHPNGVFQLTRPCGSRLQLCQSPITDISFQLTRPCGSRQ